jgi:hypothetical protein
LGGIFGKQRSDPPSLSIWEMLHYLREETPINLCVEIEVP